MKTLINCTVVTLFTLLAFSACDTKNCEDWADDIESDCCDGKSNCSLTYQDKKDAIELCKDVEKKCGTSSLECKGEKKSSSTCMASCGCQGNTYPTYY